MTDYDAGMRRLPVYLLLDCSGSMNGEPIEAVRQGMKMLLAELKGDPQALETVWISIITFDSTARVAVPLTEMMLLKEPTLQATGSTALGEALTLLRKCIEKDIRKTTATQKGDWKPLIFLMTDGEPTDDWEGPADEIRKARPGNFIACGAGHNVNSATLKRMTEIAMMLQDTQPGTLSQFFKWVSASIATTSASVSSQGEAAVNLPPPPPQITIMP
jgi:uncharacterized protein YegL